MNAVFATPPIVTPELVARVRAANEAHRHAIRLHSELVAALGPLLNKQVKKADGTLTEKARKAIQPVIGHYPTRDESGGLIVYHQASDNYAITFQVHAYINHPTGSTRHAVTFRVGKLTIDEYKVGAALTGFYNAPDLRTDYVALEVAESRLVAEEAQRALDAATDALYPFGMHDR